jgi:hypothetical protein
VLNRPIVIGLVIAAFSFTSIRADPRDGEIVSGRDFEGVIFTPKMIHADDLYIGGQSVGLWTPSRALVLKAEAALPAAIAERTKLPKPVRGPNFPRYFTRKNAIRPDFNDDPHFDYNTEDSVIESNFLYLVASYYPEQKRQYIGVTIKGRRLLLLSFAYGPGLIDQPEFNDWKHQWITVLDGGDNFWRVLYDPATGKFSGWECNGYA